MDYLPYLIGLFALGDIIGVAVQMAIATKSAAILKWNPAQQAVASRYRRVRCFAEAVVVVLPALLEIFRVLPRWSALVGLVIYLPFGLWWLMRFNREFTRAKTEGN